MAIKRNIEMWACSKCGKLYSREEWADKCCQEYHCDICGKATPQYVCRCQECSDKLKFEKAEKMTEQQWNEKYKDIFHMVTYDGEHYFESIESFKEYWEEEQYIENGEKVTYPDFIWDTVEIPIKVDAEWAIQSALENSNCEDLFFDAIGEKELIDYVNNWNKKYCKEVYEANYKVAIILNKE